MQCFGLQLRDYEPRFRPNVVKQLLRETMIAAVATVSENCLKGEQLSEMSRTLAEEIRRKLTELDYEKYKFVVQALVGERRGQGIKYCI
ncbi:unnamed protein product [Soboliphyme baturini]|uniref:Four helix bundle protein n=1 Tax=Soboliphyme baturini TaxID=241478 RepID=A0A183J427_9BILA|nr:unnamed protein product [Soboliphyme baturini]